MAKDTVSLVLNGEVYLEDLAVAVDGWKRLMVALGKEEAPQTTLQWVVDEITTGSFFGTLRGVWNGTGPHLVERVVTRFEVVGRDIRAGNIGHYSRPIQEAATSIVGVIGKHVKSVRFETDDTDVEIYSPQPAVTADAVQATTTKIAATSFEPIPSYGHIRGRVHTVSDRRGVRFMLYEINTDRA